ncbi:MAG: helix-turn-helix transcriptional regulator [Anaerolineae bacterium]|nr:helix-turn-helix transcriptional regulator [Anaerolineae bacterium]
MSIPVLVTKLYVPPPRPSVVRRPRLLQRLNKGLLAGRKLSLISAPAGFGKTTLVSSWIDDFRWARDEGQSEAARRATIVHRVAWLSLDEGDNDPVRFLTYLVAALQTRAPSIGAAALTALDSPQPPPPEAILTALLNEITPLPDQIVLVLDDYHVLDSKPIDRALTFLLDHLPPQLHLVITTREDPSFPLARYRARDQMTELRAADLRFTPAEAAEFLHQVMGLHLSAADISALEDRTEGWIAGLQLAALSMQGREDIQGFIRAFAGDHRYIVDYLVEEVLRRQPEPIRRFLLQTAILDRLSGPLCDAVLGTMNDKQGTMSEPSQREAASFIIHRSSFEILEHLERANLFLIPLDNQRQWYRYHHLFADVLQAHLRAEQPALVPMLHRCASAWYEQHGLAADAIRHALAAQDFEHAADLIERAVPDMRRSRQEATLLAWLQALPDALVRARPVLNIHYVGTLLQTGQLDGVEARLRDAERWLDTAADRGERTDSPAAESLPGWLAIYRAGYALMQGDITATITYARRALALIAEEDHLGRGAATALLGLAYWTSGDLEAAHQTFAAGMASVQKGGYVADAIGGLIALADIRMTQGRLREAMRTYERGLRLAAEQGEPVLRGTADMYVGISELYREHNELGVAAQHLLKSPALGEHRGFPQHPYRWRVAMARLQQTQGDLDGALSLLDEAERLYVSDFFPNVRPIPALKTRVWVAQGRLGEALDWARERGLSAHDDLSYLREFEHITLARLLLARYQRDRANDFLGGARRLLARLLQAAEAGGRTGSAIEILVLQALACQLQGDIPAALVALERALTLAEPEGYIRLFVDHGPPMAALLERAVKQGITLTYSRQLLSAFGQAEDRAPVYQALIEPLSERELDVLRLLGTDLSGPDMADELTVSLNTLRTHTKNIYAKLGVNNRRAAVHRATELKLL